MFLVRTQFLGLVPVDQAVERNHWLAQLEAQGHLIKLERHEPSRELLTFDNITRHELGNLLMTDPTVGEALLRYEIEEVALSGPLIRSAGNRAAAQRRRNPAD